MVKIILNFGDDTARKAMLLLTNKLPTDEQMKEISGKEINVEEEFTDEPEQILMMSMGLIACVIGKTEERTDSDMYDSDSERRYDEDAANAPTAYDP